MSVNLTTVVISLYSVLFTNNSKELDTILDTDYLNIYLEPFKYKALRHYYPQGSLGNNCSIMQIKGVSHVCVEIYGLRLE